MSNAIVAQDLVKTYGEIHALDGLSLPLIGGPSEVTAVLERHQPHALLLTQGVMREDEAVTLVRACQKHRCEVFVLPRLHEVTQVNDGMDFLGDLPLIRLRRAAYRTLSWQLKRLTDIVFSAIALLVLSPVLAACAIAVLSRSAAPAAAQSVEILRVMMWSIPLA